MSKGVQSLGFSITEVLHPGYRKGPMKHGRTQSLPSQKQQCKTVDPKIFGMLQQLSGYIKSLQQFFRTRMKVHEQELIQIAHSQIKKIQAQSQKVINHYSQLIYQRNISLQIKDLKYQILYYQRRACDLYQENSQLKSQIKQLKNQITSMKIGQHTDHIALKNISKKYLKEKSIKQKLQYQFFKRQENCTQNSNRKLNSLLYNPQKSEMMSTKMLESKHVKSKAYYSRSEDKNRNLVLNLFSKEKGEGKRT